MGIKIIAGVSHNGVIGKAGDLALRHKEDLQRFRRLTYNSVVVMGRKTWDSLGSKPLRGRSNFVITREVFNEQDRVKVVDDRDIYRMTLSNFLMYHRRGQTRCGVDYWIIGGGEIYKQLMSIVDELHITRWNKSVEGDTFFPEIDLNLWELVGLEEAKTTDEFVFETWRRKEVKDG